MRRIILLLPLILAPFLLQAQDKEMFKMAPDGSFILKNDNKKSFFISEHNGKSQEDLYRLIIAQIKSINCQDEKMVIEEEKSDYLIVSPVLNLKKTSAHRDYKLYLMLSIQFKDNKIKVNAPSYKLKKIDQKGHISELTFDAKRSELSSEITGIVNDFIYQIIDINW